MFKFLDILKKKKTVEIPTIKATKQHKIDDKKQHDLFLSELKEILINSKLFKLEYIPMYVNLYKKYVPFQGKDFTLIQKQSYFFNSLIDESGYKKTEIKKYAKNLAVIAQRRATHQINLDRYLLTGIKKVEVYFSNNETTCKDMIKYRKRIDKKVLPIAKAPIFPLVTCFKCSSCSIDAAYKPIIET